MNNEEQEMIDLMVEFLLKTDDSEKVETINKIITILKKYFELGYYMEDDGR